MAGMRLGGIDPSILRELSGVYKPFVKAFKELISNAFDADADNVRVAFADDFSWASVEDDGQGMNPYEFRNDFARIGGGSRRWAGDATRKGRPRIGSKGIGFLALARYCDHLVIESSARRRFSTDIEIPETSRSFDVAAAMGVPVSPDLLRGRITCDLRRTGKRGARLIEGRDYRWGRNAGQLIITATSAAPLSCTARVDCRDLRFRACLDFERLLRLADYADLEKLDDFATIDVSHASASVGGTIVRAEGLKGFVRRELRTDRRKGFVRNIGSRSGLEQFTWHLERCTPITYSVPPENPNPGIATIVSAGTKNTLTQLTLLHGSTTKVLHRPTYPLEATSRPIPPDMLHEVRIDEGGLKATGFLAGCEGVIFPAEYRGIAIRVRGVSIGDNGFLGAESLTTGASKAALSQITGEVIVAAGLDAVDALNPGRESFYEESDHFKILRRHLVGEGERVGGYLGRTIASVLRRSQVRSSLADTLGKATMRRRAFEDVSAAVANLVTRNDQTAALIRKMLSSRVSHVNGLGTARPMDIGVPPKIGGLPVVASPQVADGAHVDYKKGHVLLDTTRPEWQWSLLLFDRTFAVVPKRGTPDQPIGEIDLKDGTILVNWGHPVKLQMDERGFLRTALAWVIARAAADKNPDRMMDLALKLLAYSTASNG